MIHIIFKFCYFIFFKKSVCIGYWNEGICGCWNIGNCETNGFKWCLKRKCLERHTFHEVLRIIVSWGMREMTIDIKKMWIIKCLTPYQEEAHVSTRTEDKIHLRSKQFGQKTPAATTANTNPSSSNISVAICQDFNFLSGDFEAAFVHCCCMFEVVCMGSWIVILYNCKL